MRNYIPSGVSHSFCTICNRKQCNGHGDEPLGIPDHEPDMDGVEEPGSYDVRCNICGKPILHDYKGDPEKGTDTWRHIVNAFFNGPDDLDTDENDDDVDFCATCWETIIKPLFNVESNVGPIERATPAAIEDLLNMKQITKADALHLFVKYLMHHKVMD